jgi:hypothetical protein
MHYANADIAKIQYVNADIAKNFLFLLLKNKDKFH